MPEHRQSLAQSIVLMGVSGSGKSTVGKLLSTRTGAAFFDGDDLDIRTRIVSIGSTIYQDQNAPAKYIGWDQEPITPATATYIESGQVCNVAEKPLAIWGGDNQDVGYESVMIDFTQIPAGQDQIVIDCRAFWYVTLGVQPVNIGFTLLINRIGILFGSSKSMITSPFLFVFVSPTIFAPP